MFRTKIIKSLSHNGYTVICLFIITIFVLSLIPNQFLNAKNNKEETYKQFINCIADAMFD